MSLDSLGTLIGPSPYHQERALNTISTGRLTIQEIIKLAKEANRPVLIRCLPDDKVSPVIIDVSSVKMATGDSIPMLRVGFQTEDGSVTEVFMIAAHEAILFAEMLGDKARLSLIEEITP